MKEKLALYFKFLWLICISSIVVITSIFLILPNVSANPNNGYDITNKVRVYNENDLKDIPAYPNSKEPLKNSYMYGNKNFPLVGISVSGSIFLDKKSCKYEVIDNVGYLSCIVYYGGGGADSDGNAYRHSPVPMYFCTFKPSNKRVIKFLGTISKNGKNNDASYYRSDNGFLHGLFWYAAKCLGINQYLD